MLNAICLMWSCLPKSVEVHLQYHSNPAAGFATKERRCPGRSTKIERCGEHVKEGAKETEVYKKEGKWG